MKQLFTLFILLFISQLSGAQQNTNLVFFSEEGRPFYIVLNGIQQNANPETNVRVTNLIQPYYKVKVMFTDGVTPAIDKTINFNAGTETTYAIRKSNKGEVVLRWMSEVPIQQAPQPMANQQVIVYHSTPVTTTTQTTVISNTNTNPNNSEQMNVGINVNDPMTGGANINMNINVNETGMNTQTQSTSTTTYSTTTTTSGGNVGTVQQSGYVMQGYNGNVGCNGYPMNEARFNEVVKSIESKGFDDSKLTMSKQVISTNCMTSNQVKRLMLLFSFEDTRLDLAKYAYGYTYDIGNYYQLNDAFTFESSIEELNEYTSGFRR